MTQDREAYIITLGNDGSWVTVPIGEELDLGRHEGDWLVTRDGTGDTNLKKRDRCVTRISKGHARLFRKEGQLSITDLGSRNGTYMDGCDIRGGQKGKVGREHAITKPAQVFLGPFSCISISFDQERIPVRSGCELDLPVAIVDDHPSWFIPRRRSATRVSVIPRFTGTYDITEGRMVKKQPRPAEKAARTLDSLLGGCLQTVQAIICSTVSRSPGGQFDGSLELLMDEFERLPENQRPDIVTALMREVVAYKYHRERDDPTDPVIATSRTRITDHLHLLQYYIKERILKDQCHPLGGEDR